jgi:hypothetical protein
MEEQNPTTSNVPKSALFKEILRKQKFIERRNLLHKIKR